MAVQITGDSACELLAILLQCGGEAGDLIRRERQFLRIHPNGINRGADGEWLTVSIGDGSAMSGDGGYTRNACVTLLRQKGVIDELQADGTPNQPAGTAGE